MTRRRKVPRFLKSGATVTLDPWGSDIVDSPSGVTWEVERLSEDRRMVKVFRTVTEWVPIDTVEKAEG